MVLFNLKTKRKVIMKRNLLFTAATLLAASAMSASLDINIDCAQPTVKLSPHLYGLFFEDINYAADGGLYAELVQNRSFEYYSTRGNDALGRSMHPLFAWEAVERDGASVDLKVEDDNPLNDRNTNYLKVDIEKSGTAGVLNTGFDGFPVDAGKKYDISLYARKASWFNSSELKMTLETADGTVCGETELSGVGKDWKKLEGVITANQTADAARLLVTTSGKGVLYLDMVSLFPQDTFMGRKNGMRKDLGQALKDLNPKFLRFPGGCIAHGDGIDNVYRWKDTVGDVAFRKPNWNRWGYHQTYGLGYYEYFLLCEDIGATPLPVIPVGVSCGFTRPQECVPMGELGPWIDDALDLIEFCNGPVTSTWGGLRAKMGHPAPFNLQFVALGNEPHDNALFRDRFPLFAEAIRKAHPEIKIVGTSGLGPEIPVYDLMTKEKVYSSDEHYYMSPDWFLNNTHRFDNFDRSKPLIFVGEYAAHDAGRINTMYSALSEAAFLTGVERNGDMVDMTCYAPLFGHRLHSQWSPDMIYFDNRNLVKTANYYVQQLFACNKGDVYLANEMKVTDNGPKPTIAGSVGIGSWHTTIEIDDVAVNGTSIDPSTWQVNSGNFEEQNGNYRQLDVNAEPAISLGSRVFDNDTVTYTLRARKNGGNEGFLIIFGRQDDGSSYWWNIGGWGNSKHAIQFGNGNAKSIVTEAKGSIETGKWYDIKVVLSPGNIKCYLDGQLIHDYAISQPMPNISTTLDKDAGEVIVKLVNPTPKPLDSHIHLNGVEQVEPEAKLMLLAGDRQAHNTFENPDEVKTETSTIQVGKSFDYTMPPMSVQFIRIKAK